MPLAFEFGNRHLLPPELLRATVLAEIIDFQWHDFWDIAGESLGPAQLNLDIATHYDLQFPPTTKKGGWTDAEKKEWLKHRRTNLDLQAEKLDKMIEELSIAVRGGGSTRPGVPALTNVPAMHPDYRPWQTISHGTAFVDPLSIDFSPLEWNVWTTADDYVERRKDPRVVYDLITPKYVTDENRAERERLAAAALIGVLAKLNDANPRATGNTAQKDIYATSSIGPYGWQSGLIYQMIRDEMLKY